MSKASYRLGWAITFVVSAAVLCAVALLNGGPIVYADTGLYILDGERVLQLKAPLAVRPVFYGVAIYFLHWDRTLWPVLLAQGVVVAHIIWLTLRVIGAGLRPLSFVALVIGLALLTPLSWHVSHVLPDVFAGVLILAMFLLGFCRAGLGRAETVYLFLLASAAICFHLTNLVIASLLLLVIVFCRLFLRPLREMSRPVLAGAPIALALLAFFSLSVVVFNRLTITPNSPPHLMARLIMDGPGRDYLRAVCPTSELAICKHEDIIPDSYEAFLWGFMNVVPPEDGKRIRAEEGAVLRGTVLMFPLEVAWHAIENTAMQLVTIESRTDFPRLYWDQLEQSGGLMWRAAQGSLQARGLLDGDTLDDVNTLHAGVALISFLACAVLMRSSRASRLYAPAGLIAWVFLGLGANAFAGGALSGVFGRYQGRVVWLLPLAAVAASIALARNRPQAPTNARRERARAYKV